MSYNKASKAKSFNKNGKKKMPDQTKSTVLTLVIIAAVVVVAVGLIAFLLIMDGIKPYEITEEKTNYVCLSVAYTDKNGDEKTGDIVVELYPNKAPITVENFQNLVADGFYDGLTFHRVVSDFMIQGGCPKGTGKGGNEDENGNEINIKGEFAANGVDTGIQHVRGTLSMARNGYDYNSASSQFFIVHTTSYKNSYSLDGQYAAFGSVIYGIEHVDGIAGTATNPANDKPYKNATIVSADFVNITGELD